MDKSKLFDQKIRDAINKFEVPFDDSGWKNIESKINVQPKGKIINWKTWIISTAAAAALVIGYFVINPSAEEVNVQVENKKTEVLKTNDSKIDTEENNLIVEEDKTLDASDKNEPTKNVSENKTPTLLPLIEDEELISVDQDNIEEEEQLLTDVIIENVNDNSNELENEVEQLALSIHISKEVLCENEALSISMTKCNVPVELTWDFGDGQVAEGASVTHIYNEEGEYKVQMNAHSVIDESLVSSESYTITVNPRPDAAFEISKNDNMAAYPEVTFKSINDPLSSLEWKFNDENVKNSTIVEKMYRTKGSYSIGLVVKNQFQCTDTLYQYLVIENNFNLLAPNAFSPNGDGINDTFMPQALPYLNQGFTLQVFEPKTGQMIFESSDFTIPWNGNIMNNGNKMADGAYAWSVKTDDGSVYKGTILITTK